MLTCVVLHITTERSVPHFSITHIYCDPSLYQMLEIVWKKMSTFGKQERSLVICIYHQYCQLVLFIQTLLSNNASYFDVKIPCVKI